MVETREKAIGSTSYRVTQLPSSRARKLLVRLFKTAGPAISKLVDGFAGKLADMDTKAIGLAIEALAFQLTEDDLEFAIEQIIDGGFVTYKAGANWPQLTNQIVEIHFVGKTDELLKLLGFALEVNYGGFFGGKGIAAALGRQETPPASSPSNSPETLTG